MEVNPVYKHSGAISAQFRCMRRRMRKKCVKQLQFFSSCKRNTWKITFVKPLHASTYTSDLQKKKIAGFLIFRLFLRNSTAYVDACVEFAQKIIREFLYFKKYIFLLFCANLPHASTHASNLRKYFLCTIAPNAQKMAQICNFCAFKNHYIAPRIRSFRRLGRL